MFLEGRYIESVILTTATDSLREKLVAAHNSFVNSQKDVHAWPYYGVNYVETYLNDRTIHSDIKKR